MNTVGKKVRYFRQIKGLTQENLAKYIDKSQNWVSELENGEKELSKELKTAISNFLEIDENLLNTDNNITYFNECKNSENFNIYNIKNDIDEIKNLIKELIDAIKNR